MKYDVEGKDGDLFPSPCHVRDAHGRLLSPLVWCNTDTGEAHRYVVKDGHFITNGGNRVKVHTGFYPYPLVLIPGGPPANFQNPAPYLDGPNAARLPDLFQLGDFTLHSGAKSKWKIECDALSDGAIGAIAEMVNQMIGRPFGSVVGIPRGGMRLADALMPMATPSCHRLLIVDDVLTTGKSFEEAKSKFSDANDIIGAVIFARGKCPSWIKAICPLPQELWIK